jgi:hypothetical protein
VEKLAETRKCEKLEVDMKIVLAVFVAASHMIPGGSDLLSRQDRGAQKM